MFLDVKAGRLDCEVNFGEVFKLRLEVLVIDLENTFPCKASIIGMLLYVCQLFTPHWKAYPTSERAKMCGSMGKALRQSKAT